MCYEVQVKALEKVGEDQRSLHGRAHHAAYSRTHAMLPDMLAWPHSSEGTLVGIVFGIFPSSNHNISAVNNLLLGNT